MNERTLSFLNKCRTTSVVNVDTYKIEVFMEIFRCQVFEVKCFGPTVLSNKFFVNVSYMYTTYILVGLQFYFDNCKISSNFGKRKDITVDVI
ncbi:hypothetical protein Trydic_g5212 [Trypoxylus dichotomus]